MGKCQTRVIRSANELRAIAPAWDGLWQRSEVTSPTARAELVAQWVEQFQPKARLQAVVVEHGGRLVAALPLTAQTLGGVMPEAALTGNEWSPCGDLLLDPNADNAAVDALLLAAGRLGAQLLWLDGVDVDAARWRRFVDGCARRGATATEKPRFDVGRLAIDHDWEAYKLRLSRSHRQSMNKAVRKLQQAGDLRFEILSDVPAEHVECWLFQGFEVEDRSWKGRAGTSVLRTPGMLPFFVRQAAQLAAWGQLELARLDLNRRPIAFLYGYRGKGVLHAHKIGYDPDYADFSPGQVLFYHLFERLHAETDCHAVDFVGPLMEATSRWRPEPYRLGRLVVAPRSLLGKAAVHFYERWWPALKRWTSRSKPAITPIVSNE